MNVESGDEAVELPVATLEEGVEVCEDRRMGGVVKEVAVLTEAEVDVEVRADVEVEMEVEPVLKVTSLVSAEVDASTIVVGKVELSTIVLREEKREVIVPPGSRLIPPELSQLSLSKQHCGFPSAPNPAQYVPGRHPTISLGQHVYELGMQKFPQYSKPWPQNSCRANKGA